MRMVGIAFQLDHTVVLYLGKQATTPDAHLAHAGNIPIPIGIEMARFTGCLCYPWRKHLTDSQSACSGGA
jgi:hypothetical protein